MRKLLLVSLLLLAACASLQKKVDLPWPETITRIEAEGDIDMAWRDEKFNGSVALKMDYPDFLNLEVYGAFGQTLLFLKKDGGEFLFVAGDERITSEAVFRSRHGIDVRLFMDDMAMRGTRVDGPEGSYIMRDTYRVTYGHNTRGRRTIRWEGRDGRILLTLAAETFDGRVAEGGDSSRNP